MTRYKATIAYDGTDFAGFQSQTNQRTVQKEIEKILTKLNSFEPVILQGSGRTDSGVHAFGQVIHFDYPTKIEEKNLQRAFNSLLPDDISAREVVAVSDEFHARYSVTGKRYIYRVNIQKFVNPFNRLYTLHHPYRVNVDKMNEALQAVIGEHDFTSFCSTKTDKESKVRTVTKAEVVEQDGVLVFTFEGNGFLYNMIRILVGTSLQIGDGLRPVSDMKAILEARDRQKAGPTAPPQGLYLDEVFYEEKE